MFETSAKLFLNENREKEEPEELLALYLQDFPKLARDETAASDGEMGFGEVTSPRQSCAL